MTTQSRGLNVFYEAYANIIYFTGEKYLNTLDMLNDSRNLPLTLLSANSKLSLQSVKVGLTETNI